MGEYALARRQRAPVRGVVDDTDSGRFSGCDASVYNGAGGAAAKEGQPRREQSDLRSQSGVYIAIFADCGILYEKETAENMDRTYDVSGK